MATQKYTFQTVVIETNIVELFVAIHNEQVHMHLNFTHTYNVHIYIFNRNTHVQLEKKRLLTMSVLKPTDCFTHVSFFAAPFAF